MASYNKSFACPIHNVAHLGKMKRGGGGIAGASQFVDIQEAFSHEWKQAWPIMFGAWKKW
jgi:hypothetical protein